MRFCLLFVLFLASTPSPAQTPSVPPKAARTVNMVYDIGEADVYYDEMIIEKTADGSFFMACGWDNGYFGLQQYDGDNKRAIIFTVWNDPNEKDPAPGPAEILWANDRGKTNKYGLDGKGAQFMRQLHWRMGESYRFVVDAVVTGTKTTYTAWFYDPAVGSWEKLATMRAESQGKWLRGYNSFIEDFRRDTRSAKETRQARFGSVWIHQFKGTWVEAVEATFVASVSRSEDRDHFDGDESGGFFMLTNGGETVKKRAIGERLILSGIPLRKPDMPSLPFLKLDKPAP